MHDHHCLLCTYQSNLNVFHGAMDECFIDTLKTKKFEDASTASFCDIEILRDRIAFVDILTRSIVRTLMNTGRYYSYILNAFIFRETK